MFIFMTEYNPIQCNTIKQSKITFQKESLTCGKTKKAKMFRGQ